LHSQRPFSNPSFRNAFALALDSIRAHKLRSFLTLLGVIIGVASVILVGAAIEGLSIYAEESTSKAFGSNSYFIAQIASTGRLSRRELFDRMRRNRRLQQDDVEYLKAANADTTFYSSYRQRTAKVNRNGFEAEEVSIVGVGSALVEIRQIALVAGRFFGESEERSRAFVGVIGEDVRSALFPTTDSPVGEIFKIEGIEFQVVGVQEKLGSAFGRTQDNIIYIPATVFARLYGPGQSLGIFGKPRPESGLTLEESLDLSRVALRTRFHQRPGEEDRFDTLTPDAIRGFIDNLLSLISAIVVPVTSISLVVGGIVIMNIMLVSVTERTREIGIRKSLGARRSDIMLQVLIEAVLMAAAGGILGVAMGAAATAALARAFEIDLAITMTYVVLAVAVSTIVGVASGWYPASRASRLDPVVALRAE
jgi:putative ABC transport system permease protein